MEFRVLGPLRVEDEGNSYPLGGPKQRTLLALLIAAGGTAVSTDALVMGVYGPDGDPKDLHTLRTYISTFRRSLGGVIERHGDGYRLDVDPDTIDAQRFESMIHRARTTVNASRSAAILRDALGLWRGRPYGDTTNSAQLRAEIRRLEELHTEALEARIDLDLAAGRHRQLLAELEDLVAMYPVREGLRSRQMLALYRSGRQTDALEAYRNAVDHLKAESGLDPSRELAHLELQILNHDDDLDYRPRPRARTEPVRYTSFVGRETETAQVIELLNAHRLVTITGPGGIGKSSLGAEVARTLADSMATVYVPIESQRAADPLLLVAKSLGLTPFGGSDVFAMVSHALDGTTTMILLDGCEHVVDQLPPIVDELLGRCPSIRILITSRERLSIAGEGVFELGPLSHGDGSDSDRLFAHRAGVALEELDPETRVIITEVGERLSGMPLALELAAARWESMTPRDLVAQLDDQLTLLSARRGADRRHTSIVAALDWSHNRFDPATREAFRRLSAFRGEIQPEGAKRILGVADPIPILQDLVDVSMLVFTADGEHQMLEPIRQYAWKQLEESGDLDETRQRYVMWIIERCSSISRELNVTRSPSALTSLRSEGSEIAAIAAWALEHDQPDVVLSIVAAVGRIWWLALDPSLLRDTAVSALDHPQATTGDVMIRAVAHTAFLYRTTDRATTRGLMKRLGSIAKEPMDPGTTAIVLQMRALLSQSPPAIYGTEDHDRIITGRLALLDESFGIAKRVGSPTEPELYNRSYLLEALRRFDEADKALETLLNWASESNSVDRGSALIRLAMSKLRRSAYSEGVDMAGEATRLLLDAGHLSMAADAEWVRSYGHFYLGEYKQGLRWLQRGDEHYRLVGMPPARIWNPVHFAMFAAAFERWDDVEAAIGDFVTRAPDSTRSTARMSFLLGHPSVGSTFIRALYPSARWLIAQSRYAEAAQIVAAAPDAQRETGLSEWDMGAVLGLTDELSSYSAFDHPETLEDLFVFIAERFSHAATTVE